MGYNCSYACAVTCFVLFEDPPAYLACFAVCMAACAGADP